MSERTSVPPKEEHRLKRQNEGVPLGRAELSVIGDPERDLGNLGALAVYRGDVVNIFPQQYRRNRSSVLTSSHITSWPEGEPDYEGSAQDLALRYPQLGWEHEGHVIDAEGSPTALSPEQRTELGAAATRYGLTTSAELMDYSVEVGTERTASSLQGIEKAQMDYLRFVLERRAANEMVYPGSSMPGAEHDGSAFSTDPHVLQIVHNVLGPERTALFTAISTQLTIETPSPLHGARAALQITPAITAIELLGQSSPASGPARLFYGADLLFDDGRSDPNKDRTLLERVDGLGPVNWHAVRSALREIGLNTGGVIKNIPPLDALRSQDAYLDWLAEVTKENLADRQLGGHTVRVRSHKPTGAIELPDPDNAGLRMERLTAMHELQLKLSRLAMDPIMQSSDMKQWVSRAYPDVFLPLTNDKHIHDTIEAERVHRLGVARYGKQAEIRNPDGHTHLVSDRLRRVVSFLDVMGLSVSRESRIEIEQALQTVPDVQTSFETYYRKGLGTFSEAWQAAYDRTEGANEKIRMQRVNLQASRAFYEYARRRVGDPPYAATA